jgi:GH15 family glucan-1,4-alpha-glucosidase
MPTLSVDDYGVIGNYTSTALVSRLGSIDWCCFPYLDSPSHLSALLDQGVGGRFQITPQGDFRSEQRYRNRSLVLETLFETPFGRAVLTDWMPLHPSQASDPVIYRQLDIIEGKISWTLTCDPRFDYGETPAEAELHSERESEISKTGLWSPKRLLFRGGLPGQIAQLFLSSNLGNLEDLLITPKERFPHLKRAVEARFTLSTGDSVSFAWAWGRRIDAPPFQSFRETAEAWKHHSHPCVTSGCLFAGPWHDSIVKAGMFLRLLIAPYSGSIAEAVTTSIPGVHNGGGEGRTWDYRYAWIRNSPFVLQALASLGMKAEAKNYFGWLSEIVIRDGVESLQPVYTLDGGKILPEREISGLRGFHGAGPVRVGNDAAQQFHLDVYGHVLLAADYYHREWGSLPEGLWERLSEIADFLCGAWRRPDHGPWEIRGKPEHYVASKALCWAALDRACLIAKRLGVPVPPRWLDEMPILHRTICDQGFDSTTHSFVRSFGDTEVDASVLLLPLIGFLPFDDTRIEGTLAQVQSRLADGVLIHRYRSSDGVRGADAPHLFSSFLFIANLALSGRVDEASDRMAELCSFASSLGFFAEQVDPGLEETSGNFPSASSHLALITAALYIGAARGRELPIRFLLGNPVSAAISDTRRAGRLRRSA